MHTLQCAAEVGPGSCLSSCHAKPGCQDGMQLKQLSSRLQELDLHKAAKGVLPRYDCLQVPFDASIGQNTARSFKNDTSLVGSPMSPCHDGDKDLTDQPHMC